MKYELFLIFSIGFGLITVQAFVNIGAMEHVEL